MGEPSDKVTLEELLRIKRAEQPGPEFWQKFDRELHRRTLKSFYSSERRVVSVLQMVLARIQTAVATGAVAAALLAGWVYVQMLTIQPSGRPVSLAEVTSVMPGEYPAAASSAQAEAYVPLPIGPDEAGAEADFSPDLLQSAASQDGSPFQRVMHPETLSAGPGLQAIYLVDTLSSAVRGRSPSRGSSF